MALNANAVIALELTVSEMLEAMLLGSCKGTFEITTLTNAPRAPQQLLCGRKAMCQLGRLPACGGYVGGDSLCHVLRLRHHQLLRQAAP